MKERNKALDKRENYGYQLESIDIGKSLDNFYFIIFENFSRIYPLGFRTLDTVGFNV